MAGLAKGTWVLVLDGAKALILERREDEDGESRLRVVQKEEQDSLPNRELHSDRAGRMHDPGPGQKSAIEPTDHQQLAEDAFAVDMADRLYKAAHRGRFKKLVLVAGPNALGPLRAALHKEVSDRVVAEIPKTLTNHPLPEIERLVLAEMVP